MSVVTRGLCRLVVSQVPEHCRMCVPSGVAGKQGVCAV